jgi:hypothetical protein
VNIYAAKGSKVRCHTLSAGYEYEQRGAKQYLVIGKEYTVEKTYVGKFYTRVVLQELPDKNFSTVFFEDVLPVGQQKFLVEDTYTALLQKLCLLLENTLNASKRQTDPKTVVRFVNRRIVTEYQQQLQLIEILIDDLLVFKSTCIITEERHLTTIREDLAFKTLTEVFIYGIMAAKRVVEGREL